MHTRLALLGQRVGGWLEKRDPVRVVIAGYLSYVLLGWALLCLPVSHAGPPASAIDHLFMATSAMSTTGLATVSTSDTYTAFGQGVILALIQAGGLGYMTLGSFVVLALSGRLAPWRERVSGATFVVPQGFHLPHFLRLMVWYTVAIEAVGAILLYLFVFRPHGAADPVWQAVFHSVSAFCTAGFGLFNDSFESFRGDVPLNLILIALSYLGAVGFIIVSDAWHVLRGQRRQLTLTSKIILLSTACISLGGTFLFALEEPAVAALPAGERWLASWFQVMTASTTVGFDTLPINTLSASSSFLLVTIMLVGASPAGTGGGLKTTTVTALWAVMTSVIRRRRVPTFLGREVPVARVHAAVAQLVFYGGTLAAGVYALALVDRSPLADQLFECASALGTVGLSRGITGTLSLEGKLIVTALMFVGRIGPIAMGMALFQPRTLRPAEAQLEDVAI
jgi:trk system potassium uptake protein TrkH